MKRDAGIVGGTALPHSPDPWTSMRYPVIRMRWDWLTFLHWPYEPAEVQRLLPDGLQVEPYDGAAWVGLVPFRMHVRGPVGPSLPGLANFPETNVRTYVRGPDGSPGIWFFSLDAARLIAVLTARFGLGLPYVWSRMRVERDGDLVTYRSSRGRQAASSFARLRAGSPFGEKELTGFDHYLTARFRLWTVAYGALLHVDAEHHRWPLRRAEVLDLRDGLVAAAGLPPPTGAPVTHYSEGVDVRIGLPAVARGR